MLPQSTIRQLLLVLSFAAPSLLIVTAPAAQDDPYAKELAALNKSVTKRLTRFARLASRNGVASRAREVYQLIVDNYDPQNTTACKALGYEKKGRVWTKPETLRLDPSMWRDKANDEKRFEVLGDWNEFARSIGAQHRELGLKMLDDGVKDRAEYQLGRALYFNPLDVNAHKALGHTEVDGFWGTAEDVAFVTRLRDIEVKAAELSKREYEFEELPHDAMPAELRKIYDEDNDYEFFGAKNKHFEFWTRGNQKNANDCVLWAERACDFIKFLLPKNKKRINLRATFKANRSWVGFIWTRAEQELLIRLNPNIDTDLNFANNAWRTQSGVVEVTRALTPVSRIDKIISKIVKLLGGNDAINEGVMHAATWYLRGSTVTRYGAIDPNKTVSGGEETLPDAGAWWMREIRDQSTAGTSFRLNAVPRVQLSDFRNDARIKTWSFHVWCLARYPKQWFDWLYAFQGDARPFPDKVDEKGAELFGRPLAEVEAEWRWWAAGRSGTASATGYGPPLLPDAPNKDQLRALKRLNEFRAIAGLPPCEIDLEATEACKKHALFLQQNPDTHWTWPEAHEESPSLPGFTTPGQRAGMRSVIITSYGGDIDAADSLDNWVGTVYHRFPLLEPSIRRIGFGHVGNVVVLDMGSLREPTTPDLEEKWRFIKWPLDGMEGVPLNFHPREQPDPLQFTDEGRDNPDLQLDVGYPVSLQIRDSVVNQLVSSRLAVFEVPKRARNRNQWKVVPCWVHAPDKPVNKNVENTSVIFAIPKERLKAKTKYQVEVSLGTNSGSQTETWSFTTGSRRTGHGRLKMGKH